MKLIKHYCKNKTRYQRGSKPLWHAGPYYSSELALFNGICHAMRDMSGFWENWSQNHNLKKKKKDPCIWKLFRRQQFQIKSVPLTAVFRCMGLNWCSNSALEVNFLKNQATHSGTYIIEKRSFPTFIWDSMAKRVYFRASTVWIWHFTMWNSHTYFDDWSAWVDAWIVVLVSTLLHYISFEIWVVKYRWLIQIPKGQ